MHEFPLILFLAVLTFAFGLVSSLSQRLSITGPMVFVAVGIAVGPAGFGLVEFHLDNALIRIVAEIALVSILFVDASTIDLRALLRHQRVPARLLLVGLPLTMLLGALIAAWLLPTLSWPMLALMAFILSPTDAALGQAVVTSKDVPENLRQAINVESGINDGMVLPPILMCIGALGAAASQQSGVYWLNYTASQLLIGPIAGGLVGYGGGWLIDFASRKRLMLPAFQRLSAIALAIMAWGLAEQLHGNGYIAAFFAGLLLFTRNQTVRHRIQDYAEAEGQQLSLMIFFIFGAVLVPPALPRWDWTSLLYAGLSLTVIRMLPVYLSLIGTQLNSRARLFIGWFGPRGIASILYLELVIMDLGISGQEQILSIIVLAVLLSVFLHGLSAVPLSRAYRQS